MKHRAIVLSLLILPFFSYAEEKKSAVINFAIGSVAVTSSGIKKIASAGTRVYQGDVIKTGQNSQADIYIDESTVLKVLASSSLTITHLKDTEDGGDKSSFYLSAGKMLSSIKRKLTKGEEYKVKTATATASIRGTEFLVEAANGESVVACTSGSVSVTNDISTVMVKEGEEIPLFKKRRMKIRAMRAERRNRIRAWRKNIRQLRKEYRNRLKEQRKIRRELRKKRRMERKERRLKRREKFLQRRKERRERFRRSRR